MAGGRPLYHAAGSAVRAGGGHAGLWYDKFCDRWRDDQGNWSMSVGDEREPKSDWIEAITGSVGADGDRLPEYARRLVRLVTAREGWLEVFTARERFVTGLGRSHPVENGFAWHPTLGTPYLPGSSVKGLTRAWADEQGQRDDADRLLGGRTSAGELLFLDAVPPEPVRLEADVMTPHYANWTPEKPPGDWCAPNPIPFLVAAAGTSLLVAVLPRRPGLSGDGWQVVQDWLRSALETAGAGAKTAVSYGRFQPDPDRTGRLRRAVDDADRGARRRRERAQAMATPEGRWRVRIAEASEQEVQDLVREQLESGQLVDPVERVALARAVAEAGYPDLWRRGRTGTETGERRLKQLRRQVTSVLAEADEQ